MSLKNPTKTGKIAAPNLSLLNKQSCAKGAAFSIQKTSPLPPAEWISDG
jgi:hypothetical protein